MLAFFQQDDLGEMWDLIQSVSECFHNNSCNVSRTLWSVIFTYTSRFCGKKVLSTCFRFLRKLHLKFAMSLKNQNIMISWGGGGGGGCYEQIW